MNNILLVVIVMISEGLLHYFPWKMLLRGRELPRVAAYILGVLGLMAPFTAWLWERGEMEIIRMLWMVIVAGGLMVLALYGLDHYTTLEMRDLEAREERALRRNETQG